MVIVKKYHTEKNRNMAPKETIILESMMFLITPPSVAQKSEDRSLLLMVVSVNRVQVPVASVGLALMQYY